MSDYTKHTYTIHEQDLVTGSCSNVSRSGIGNAKKVPIDPVTEGKFSRVGRSRTAKCAERHRMYDIGRRGVKEETTKGERAGRCWIRARLHFRMDRDVARFLPERDFASWL